MATKTASKNDISPELKAYIENAIEEALNDPDFGLELTAYAKKRLQHASRKKQKWISFEEIKRKYL